MEKIAEKRFNCVVRFLANETWFEMMKKHMSEKDSQFWAQFLPEIKKTIEGTLAAVVAREEVQASLSESAAETFDGRLNEFQVRIAGCARRPEETMAAAEALLQEAEEEYRGKLAGIEALRQKLADWAGRAIE